MLTWKSKLSKRAMSMLPGSFTVPRLTPSSSSPAGTMPPFPAAAHGGLTATMAWKPRSHSRFFQHPAPRKRGLLVHACFCSAVDEKEELGRRVSNILPCSCVYKSSELGRVQVKWTFRTARRRRAAAGACSFVRTRRDKLMSEASCSSSRGRGVWSAQHDGRCSWSINYRI